MTTIIDSDQHLFEERTLWADHIDPALKTEALSIVDDDLGYAWLTWRGVPLDIADVQIPGDTDRLGQHRQRCREKLTSDYHYDETPSRSLLEPISPGETPGHHGPR